MTIKRTFYCCTTDWQHELGGDVPDLEGSLPLYSTVEKLKEKSKCWKECGIVEVIMTGTIVEKGTVPWVKY